MTMKLEFDKFRHFNPVSVRIEDYGNNDEDRVKVTCKSVRY